MNSTSGSFITKQTGQDRDIVQKSSSQLYDNYVGANASTKHQLGANSSTQKKSQDLSTDHSIALPKFVLRKSIFNVSNNSKFMINGNPKFYGDSDKGSTIASNAFKTPSSTSNSNVTTAIGTLLAVGSNHTAGMILENSRLYSNKI